MKKKFQNWEGITVERIRFEKRDQRVGIYGLTKYYEHIWRDVAAGFYRQNLIGCRLQWSLTPIHNH